MGSLSIGYEEALNIKKYLRHVFLQIIQEELMLCCVWCDSSVWGANYKVDMLK